ncbi:hypothetical protein [Sulfodiicoccus acidiphilus]|uniref:hypothetical protein n=1 Tax=Sulfodiicoccus acidiphilus TaxID=1670455 RepID=UPI0035716A81
MLAILRDLPYSCVEFCGGSVRSGGVLLPQVLGRGLPAVGVAEGWVEVSGVVPTTSAASTATLDSGYLPLSEAFPS